MLIQPILRRGKLLAASTCLAAIVVGAFSSGCAIRKPDWRSPGTVQEQMYRATTHDPYGYNDVAPEIVGGRPRAYSKEVPEAVRAKQYSEPTQASKSRGLWPF